MYSKVYSTRLIRTIGRFTPLVSFSLFHHDRGNDINVLQKPIKDAPKTGWERVKKMYLGDEVNEELSLEMTHVLQSAMSATFIGACIGGFVYSKSAYLNFLHNNQATIFKSTADAKKKLQDYITVGFAKGAVRWGWRLGIFTGMYSLTATTVAVYRGDTSLIEYISAGAVAGGLYKVHLGLAATLVGSGLGAVLGAIFGGTILTILYVTGLTMDDIRKSLNRLNTHRENAYYEAVEKESSLKNDPLTMHHEHLLSEKGPQSLEDIK